MSGYKEMYCKLFNQVTNTITELQNIQCKTEEMFISIKPTEIELSHNYVEKPEGLGVIRKADELGRIVLPKELRKKLGISNHDPLEIFVEKNCIIIKKPNDGCIFCGRKNNIITFKENLVCKSCLKDII